MKKLLKPKRCVTCKTEFNPHSSLAKACSPKCAVEYTKQVRAKKQAKADREQKVLDRIKREQLKTVSEVAQDVQRVFNKFIRFRDQGKSCVSCGRPWQKNFHASHYVPAGRGSALRFDEDNVHGSCVNCNLYKSGNLTGYRIGLIERIGIERVVELESNHSTKKWTKEELNEIRSIYLAKNREFARE